MADIHPAAFVDPSADLADDVTVGPGAVVEADVRIGPGCRLHPYAMVRRFTTMGADNDVHPFAVVGGWPQDLKFTPDNTGPLTIGDHNVFREYVTLSRGTGETGTRIGSHTYWMTGAHAGHDAVIGDHVILANGSAAAGHSEVGSRAFMSAHMVIHQFCWVGEMVMTQGNAGASMHIPPYVMIANINRVVGLNVIGLRRAQHISEEDARQIKEAFAITYRRGLPMTKALAEMDECTDWGPAADRFRQFVRRVLQADPPHRRGLAPFKPGREPR